MAELQLVIMAAGMGSRYGGLKQIDEFGPSQAFLMDYAIYDAYQAGIRRVCIVVRESFRDDIASRIQKKWGATKDLSFHFVNQDIRDLPAGYHVPAGREKPWGTAHVLFVLKPHIQTPFIIMNADDFYGREGISDLAQFVRQNPGKHGLAGYPLQETLSKHGPVTRGLCEVNGDQVVSIDEVKEIHWGDPRQKLASMNLWGFQPEIFGKVDAAFREFLAKKIEVTNSEYQIPQMINDLLLADKVKVTALPVQSMWFGVTHREDKEMVQNKIASLIAEGKYPENLFAGNRS